MTSVLIHSSARRSTRPKSGSNLEAIGQSCFFETSISRFLPRWHSVANACWKQRGGTPSQGCRSILGRAEASVHRERTRLRWDLTHHQKSQARPLYAMKGMDDGRKLNTALRPGLSPELRVGMPTSTGMRHPRFGSGTPTVPGTGYRTRRLVVWYRYRHRYRKRVRVPGIS